MWSPGYVLNSLWCGHQAMFWTVFDVVTRLCSKQSLMWSPGYGLNSLWCGHHAMFWTVFDVVTRLLCHQATYWTVNDVVTRLLCHQATYWTVYDVVTSLCTNQFMMWSPVYYLNSLWCGHQATYWTVNDVFCMVTRLCMRSFLDMQGARQLCPRLTGLVKQRLRRCALNMVRPAYA